MSVPEKIAKRILKKLHGRSGPTMLTENYEATRQRLAAEDEAWDGQYQRVRVVLDNLLLQDYALGRIDFETLCKRAKRSIDTIPARFGGPGRAAILGDIVSRALEVLSTKRVGHRPRKSSELEQLLANLVSMSRRDGLPLRIGAGGAFRHVVTLMKQCGYHVTESGVKHCYYARVPKRSPIRNSKPRK